MRVRRTQCIGLALVLVLFGSAAPLCADDEPTTPAPSIMVGGEAVGAAALRAREAAVRAELAKINETPGPDAEARRLVSEPRVALAAALQGAIELMQRIAGASESVKHLKAEIEAARTRLGQLQEVAAKDATAWDVVTEEVIRGLEAKSAKAAQDLMNASESLQRLEDALKKRQADFDGISALQADRKARDEKFVAELEKTAEDAVREREVLELQIATNQVRRGVLDLRKAHHGVLLELDTLQRDLAVVQVDIARVPHGILEAALAKARLEFQVELEAEATRREADAQRKLRAVELSGSPEVRAIARLEALLGRMEAERAQEREHIAMLKTLKDEVSAIAHTARTRFASILLLYPAGGALERWQREDLAEQVREHEQDRAGLDRFQANDDVRHLNARLAHVLTKSGRMEIFEHRLAAAQDRIERSESDELRVAAIERELRHSRDEDYRLWLQARLDFISGQKQDGSTKLTPAEIGSLRKKWVDLTGKIKTAIKARRDALADISATGDELRKEINEASAALDQRREHLATITFWLREPSLFSDQNLAASGAEVSELVSRVPTLPRHVAAVLQDVAADDGGVRVRLFACWAFVLLALLFGARLRGRIAPRGLLERPVGSLGRWQRVRCITALVYRSTWLPVVALAAALYTHGEILGGRPVGAGLVALAAVWVAWGLARGLNRALFTTDEEGRCTLACDARTAVGARRVVRTLLLGSAICLAPLLVLRAADAPHLARLAGFAWGVLVIVVGVWLVFRHDVLTVFIPPGRTGLMARTMRGLLRAVWPLAVLFGGGIVALHAMGYRTAGGFYAKRVLWCALAFLGLGLLHAVTRAFLHRRLSEPADFEDEDAADAPQRLQLAARFLGGLLAAVLFVGLILTLSLVFDLRQADWSRLGAISLTGGESGTGLTLGRLVRASIIFYVALGLARFLRDVVRSVLRAREVHKGSRYVVRTLLFYSLVTLGTLAALSALGVEMSQFGWFLTAAGVGIGFGLQEIISNFICGLILFFERPVQVGDVISVGDVQGDVKQINIRSTVVRTRDGVAFILPNKKLITEDVVNWSHGEKRTRVRIPFGVAYGSDVKLVHSILMRIATEHAGVMKRPPPEVNFLAFGESELQFELMAWLPTPDPTQRRRAVSAINTRVDDLFRENNVHIPFPQRDLHLRSSDIGDLGEKRADAPPPPGESTP